MPKENIIQTIKKGYVKYMKISIQTHQHGVYPISLMVLLAFIVSLTLACENRSDDKNISIVSDDSSADNVSDLPDNDLSITENLTDANFDGYIFNIFGVTQAIGSDWFFVEEETGDVIDDAVYKRNLLVEDKYGIELSFTLIDNFAEAPKTIQSYIQAGDDTFDLYTAQQLNLGTLLISNYFVDWKQVESIDMTLPCYVQKANETYSIGDKTPLLFGDFMESNTLRCWNFIFNRSLIDEYSLENPYTVVDEGHFTLDYLNTTIRDIAQDIDGNTIMDENDLYGFATDMLATLDAFSRPCGVFAISKDENNLPVLSFMNENTVKAFEKVYDLYFNCPGTYAASENIWHIDNMFAEGKAVFASSRIDLTMNEKIRAMKDNYGILPYPKLDEEQSDYTTYLSGTFSAQMIGVTQPEADYVRTGIITQALNAYSHELVIPQIYETTLKTKLTRDENSIRMLDLILANRAYSFDSCDESAFPLSPICTFRNLLGGKKTKDIASYYASVEAQAQAWIDNIINIYHESND